MKRLPLIALVAAAAMALVGGTAKADFITGNFTSDHCTGGCLTDQTNGGTVTVTDLGGGVLKFDVELANGNQFINSGFNASFGFNLTGITQVTYSNITPSANYTIPGGNPQSAGILHMDGLGDFSFGLEGIGNGGSDPLGSSLIFTISASGLDLTDLSKNENLQFFGADIISGTTTKTGGIDVSFTGGGGGQNEVPEPTSLILLGTALAGLGLLSRRRRKA